MDASCKIQGSIHLFRLVHNMCPELWVHIKAGEAAFFALLLQVEKNPLLLYHRSK